MPEKSKIRSTENNSGDTGAANLAEQSGQNDDMRHSQSDDGTIPPSAEREAVTATPLPGYSGEPLDGQGRRIRSGDVPYRPPLAQGEHNQPERVMHHERPSEQESSARASSNTTTGGADQEKEERE